MAAKRKRSAAALSVPLRKLRPEEVTFEITTEPEDIAPEDMFSESGDAEYIRKRLEDGYDDAWCVVVVTATWEGHKGWASLGGCSLSDDYTQETVVEEHGMKREALDHLNRNIEHETAKCLDIINRLKVTDGD